MPETVVHFQVRMPPWLHERLASMAMDNKMSLNAIVVEILREATERHERDSEPTTAAAGR